MKNFEMIALMVLGITFSSCFQKALSPREYFNWAKSKESGLQQVQSGSGVHFNLKFQPADLIIANEIKNKISSEADYKTRRAELGNLAYFILKIESGAQDLLMHNVQDEQEYVRRVNYYSLSFQEDIVAVSGIDTIPCVLYQFENSYGIAPYINISLAFPGQFMNANRNEPVQVLINDRVFGNGILKFEYKKNTFHDLPELTIE